MSKMFSNVPLAVSASLPVEDTTASKAVSNDDAPAGRLLRAVEAIATKGPITYEDLRVDLGISKTATWRIVTTLRDAGWVRIIQGGRYIVLDSRLDDVFGAAQYSDREFAELADIMAQVAEEHGVHLDLFTLVVGGSPVLVETTRRLTLAVQAPLETDENLLLTIEGAMTPVQLTRHLSRRLETAEPQTAMAIRTGEIGRKVRTMRGFVWSLDRSSLTVSIRGKMGTPAAIRIAPRSRKTDPAIYRAVFVLLRARLADMVQTFGRDDRLPS